MRDARSRPDLSRQPGHELLEAAVADGRARRADHDHVGRLWPAGAPIAWRYRASAWLDCVVPTTWAPVVRPRSEVPTRISATTTTTPQIASTRRARRALAAASLSVKPAEPRPPDRFVTTPVSRAAPGPAACAATACAGGQTRSPEPGTSWPASAGCRDESLRIVVSFVGP